MLQLGVEMEKIRISSLAKELGVKSALLIEKCHEKAWQGLLQMNRDLNTLKINIYKFFPRPARKK